MIFISRFKVFFVAIAIILGIELLLATVVRGSAKYATNFYEFAYGKRESIQKHLIYEKLRVLVEKDADIISVGDSSGLYGVQPALVMERLDGLRYLSMSTAGDAGYVGYEYMALKIIL